MFAVALLVANLFHAIQVGGLQANVDEIVFDLGNPAAAPVASSSAPDIYLILLDAYPGASAIRSAPTFDGAAVPEALRARGFDVATNSRANYLVTRLTLPSLFDARHLRDIEGLTQMGAREQEARELGSRRTAAASLATWGRGDTNVSR